MNEQTTKLTRMRALLDDANVDALWLRLASSFAWATCGHLSYINTASSTGAASLLIAEKVLAGAVKPGFQTPSLAFGPDLVMEIEGVTRTDVYLAR